MSGAMATTQGATPAPENLREIVTTAFCAGFQRGPLTRALVVVGAAGLLGAIIGTRLSRGWVGFFMGASLGVGAVAGFMVRGACSAIAGWDTQPPGLSSQTSAPALPASGFDEVQDDSGRDADD